MSHDAQGFVEVTGYVAAIEAADAMAKAANVTIAMAHKVDGPDVCVICEGDVAACQAAVNAGKAVSAAKGALMAFHVIPRPDQKTGDIKAMMDAMKARKSAKNTERKARLARAAASSFGSVPV